MSYLQWLAADTPTAWWHDSCNHAELEHALSHGASGITTNPMLAYKESALLAEREPALFRRILKSAPEGRQVEALMTRLVETLAPVLAPVYRQSGGRDGFVCAQVNPRRATDSVDMIAMAKRYRAVGENILVKIPVTKAGVKAIEVCVAAGVPINATVCFSVPQALAVAEACRRGADTARRQGVMPPRSYATIMIGRLDDYLREVAQDTDADLSEADIRWAGLAVTKQAYRLYREAGYDTTLVVAALRGNYHMTELAGAEVVMSIHPTYQALLSAPDVLREVRIAEPIPADVLQRLSAMPEFIRSFAPNGLAADEFCSYGATQRTLAQFIEGGWALMEQLAAKASEPVNV